MSMRAVKRSVRRSAMVGLSLGTACVSTAAYAQDAPTPAPIFQPAQDTVNSASLIVPAGTVVPLTLVNVIKAKSTAIGSVVRATVAFPVTVGTRLAIPAGTFVEGQLVQSRFPKGYKQPKGVRPASPLKVHFTKLIYPNGYTVTLDGDLSALFTSRDAVTPSGDDQEAMLNLPKTPRAHGPAPGMDPFAGQQSTTVTDPYAHAGPNAAVIYGPIAAAVVVTTVAIILAHHHGEPLDSVVYDAGYQFQMTLTTPLTLDSTRIVKAAAVPIHGADAP